MKIKTGKRYFLSAFLLASVCSGCISATAVSKDELMELTRHWNEPKVAAWFYMGTKKMHHFFSFQDAGIYYGNYYKVKVNELEIADQFPYTSDWKKWRLMPWGPYAQGMNSQ